MPQNSFPKYLIASVVLTTLVSGCTSISTYKGEDEQAVTDPIQIKSEDEARYADTSNLMFDVLAGEMSGKLGDLETSKGYYSHAAELTDDPDIIERAMRIAIFAKDWPLAKKAANRWADVQPGNIEAQQVLGILYLREGDIDQAEIHFGRVMDAAEDSPNKGYSIITSTLLRVDEEENALELMERLVARNFDNAYGHLSYANLAMKAKKYHLAIDQSELALGFDPSLTEARVLRARALNELGDQESAFQDMGELVNSDPNNFDLRLGYARMLLQDERFDAAAEQFEILSEQRPSNADITYMLGLTYIQAENYEEAKKYFQLLIDDNRRLDESYYYLARIADDKGDSKEAERLYEEVAYGEFYLDSSMRLAELYAANYGLAKARAHLKKVRSEVLSHEDVIRIYLSEGHLLLQQEEYQQAYDIYSQGLLEYPRHPDLLYARALTADSLDRIDLLESDLQTILQGDPDNANALNALGYTLAERGLRIDEAQRLVERAYELKPNDPAIIDSMGWIQYRLGNYAQAEEYLRKALSLMDDAEIIGHLSELLWAQGNYEEARSLLREAMDRHPDDAYLQQLIKQYSE
ncbi:MAG: tetratricopeptide repeat protein [Pseudomonadota bacterium]